MKKDNKAIKDTIETLELELEKVKTLYNLYPDVKISRGIVSSSLVNSNYDNVVFYDNGDHLAMGTSKFIDVSFNGYIERVEVYSIPKQSKILFIDYSYDSLLKNRKAHIRFTSFFNTFKFKKFDDAALKEVRRQVRAWMNKYPDYEVDITNMDTKLKNYLNFK